MRVVTKHGEGSSRLSSTMGRRPESSMCPSTSRERVLSVPRPWSG